jgi:hypothetical protein
MPSVLGIIDPIAEPPHLGVERGQFTDAVQLCLVIAAFLTLDIPCRWIDSISDLDGYGLSLFDPRLTPKPVGDLCGDFLIHALTVWSA